MNAEYELLDAGNGRKLERFGAVTVVRPAPAAQGRPRLEAGVWAAAHAEFIRSERGGEWQTGSFPDPWVCRSAGREFLLAARPSGQVGLFPEQHRLRDRIASLVARALEANPETPPRVLDLFAYTGGSTMAAAGAGAQVTSVEAARGIVGWARRNVEHNDLGDASIRWIADDASRFVAREVRREARYDAIMLDPPSFGRGPGGERWKIEKDLPELLDGCVRLLSDTPLFLLATAHREGWKPIDLVARMNKAFGKKSPKQKEGELVLESAQGARVPSGVFVVRVLS